MMNKLDVPYPKISENNTGDRMNNSLAPKVLKDKKFHLIGAGGIGLSGLAKVLMANGASVTGSDMNQTAVTEKLNHLGADIQTGHSPRKFDKDTEVIISAAIPDNNPELIAARQQNLNITKYAEMLGRIINHYKSIAVCGTHGKSTTTGWLAYVMKKAEMKPNYIIGADIIQLSQNSAVDDSDCFIVEACEYDKSFLNLHPDVAVILNIEQDHLDYYTDLEHIKKAFADFAAGAKQNAVIVINADDQNTLDILHKIEPKRKKITFGIEGDHNFSAKNIRLEKNYTNFDLSKNNKIIAKNISTYLPGIHNIQNALAVIASAHAAGIDINKIIPFISQFKGMDRRLMQKAVINNITILDDYAHHPTEIRASLKAIRQKYDPKKIWCIFQPHQYSRTRFLLDDFAQSFKLCDTAIVPEIYFVRDTHQSKRLVNAEKLTEKIKAFKSEALFINDFKDIVEHLKDNVRPGQLVVTMGAGDVWKVADEYIQWLGKNS
jgi:UDP-N-acetylmuramate--alanine ligase